MVRPPLTFARGKSVAREAQRCAHQSATTPVSDRKAAIPRRGTTGRELLIRGIADGERASLRHSRVVDITVVQRQGAAVRGRWRIAQRKLTARSDAHARAAERAGAAAPTH